MGYEEIGSIDLTDAADYGTVGAVAGALTGVFLASGHRLLGGVIGGVAGGLLGAGVSIARGAGLIGKRSGGPTAAQSMEREGKAAGLLSRASDWLTSNVSKLTAPKTGKAGGGAIDVTAPAGGGGQPTPAGGGQS